MQEPPRISVSEKMWDRLHELNNSLPKDTVMEGRLPFPQGTVEVAGKETSYWFADDGDRVEIGVVRAKGRTFNEPVGSYVKREQKMFWAGKFQIPEGPSNEWPESSKIVMSIVLNLDLLFSLMAEPRLVEQSPVSKLKRKMRAKSRPEEALPHTWVKVGWTIGGKTKAKADVAGSAPARAFHIVRGHWRNYGDRHTKNSVRRPHRAGWWVWVEAHYSGDPALGETKHVYHPKLDDPGASSRVVHANIAARIAGANA